jgi:hypothetical protein
MPFIVLAEVDIHYGQKFLTAVSEIGPHILFAWMVLEGKYLKSSDLFRPTEFLHSIPT